MAMTVETLAEQIANDLVALDSIAIATTADSPAGELLLLTQGGQPFKVTVTAQPSLDPNVTVGPPAEEPDAGTETEPEEAEEPA